MSEPSNNLDQQDNTLTAEELLSLEEEILSTTSGGTDLPVSPNLGCASTQDIMQ